MANNYEEKEIETWDGIFKDLNACGVDDGYPPGTDGALAWEKLHPGKKVVDWAGRGEDDPRYKPAMDEDDAYPSWLPKEYRDGIDELNRKCREQFGLTKDAFNYYGGDKLSDEEFSKIPDEIIAAFYDLINKYKI